MSPDPITSIFSTDDTVLSHSGGANTHKSPAAHSGLVYTMGHSHALSQPNDAASGSSGAFRQMYANLSPTSQPIDLSTKSFDMATTSHYQQNVQYNVYKTEQKPVMTAGNGYNSYSSSGYIGSVPGMPIQQQASMDNGEDDDDDDYDT